MTTGVIDVGSNTVRLLVARADRGSFGRVYTEKARVGLGEEIERDGRVSDVKIAAARKAVRRLAGLAQEHGAEVTEVLVTAPGRQAANADQLLAALERGARQPVRVLSSEEEARLAYRGAVAVAQPSGALVAVCDLGGASTEVAVGRPGGDPSWLRSADLGALRLTARLLDVERPAPELVAAARAEVASTFSGITPPLPAEAFAVGGSARALRKLVGPVLGPDELAAAEELLVTRSHAAIGRRFGVSRRRTRLLLAATLILAEVQARLAVPLSVVEGGVREGAVLESLEALAA